MTNRYYHNHPSHSNLYKSISTNQEQQSGYITNNNSLGDNLSIINDQEPVIDDQDPWSDQDDSSDDDGPIVNNINSFIKMSKLSKESCNILINILHYINIIALERVIENMNFETKYILICEASEQLNKEYKIDSSMNERNNLERVLNILKTVKDTMTPRIHNLINPYFKLLLYCGVLIYRFNVNKRDYYDIIISFVDLLYTNIGTNFERFPLANKTFLGNNTNVKETSKSCFNYILSSVQKINNYIQSTKDDRMDPSTILNKRIKNSYIVINFLNELVSERQRDLGNYDLGKYYFLMKLMPSVLIVLRLGNDKSYSLPNYNRNNIDLFFKIFIDAV